MTELTTNLKDRRHEYPPQAQSPRLRFQAPQAHIETEISLVVAHPPLRQVVKVLVLVQTPNPLKPEVSLVREMKAEHALQCHLLQKVILH